MRHAMTKLASHHNAEFAQDALGALSLLVTFVGVLYLPGLL